ncbi:MAG: hypothetical protein IJH75_05610 [Mogibacterium sp.]|nr:hypothetical protein [Mogibacterium sp.]
MKYFKNHFGLTVTLVIGFLMSLMMTVAIMIITKTPWNWVSFYTMLARIYLTVSLVLFFIPVNVLGEKFGTAVGCKPRTLAMTLVSNIIPTLIINTVLAAVVPALTIFYNDAIPPEARMGAWKGAFFGGWLLTFVISYFCALLAGKAGEAVAIKSVGLPGDPGK